MLNVLLAVFENLDPMNWGVIKQSLNILWQGLLAIFVVIALIIITVKLTSLIIHKCEESKKQREENAKKQDGNNNP
ncbi:MAG: hypothetical protein IJZ32_01180 [Clostridia bacterium]|nr:hypothetical protein [Clostridia bacterium]